MVGDSRTDIVTAQAAGIPTIAVTFGYTDTPVEELGPDRIIDHYDQLFEAVRSLLRMAA
jgi:phosphoglycolate phosphatase